MLTVAEMLLKYFNIDFNCTYVLPLYISAFLLDVYIYINKYSVDLKIYKK